MAVNRKTCLVISSFYECGHGVQHKDVSGGVTHENVVVSTSNLNDHFQEVFSLYIFVWSLTSVGAHVSS